MYPPAVTILVHSCIFSGHMVIYALVYCCNYIDKFKNFNCFYFQKFNLDREIKLFSLVLSSMSLELVKETCLMSVIAGDISIFLLPVMFSVSYESRPLVNFSFTQYLLV